VGIFEKQHKDKLSLTVTGDGEQRRDFTHVYDICDGLIAMSKDIHKGDIFNLGTGTNHSINELANMFPDADIKYVAKRPGEAQTTLADISKINESTGWLPKFKLEDYIKNAST
jgi:UDP-glucose 4-epimerase